MKKMEREIYIDFLLRDTEVPPSEITKQTNIVPHVALLKGERRQEPAPLPRQNIWSIESTTLSDKIAEHWEELEQKLHPAKKTIKEIAKNGQAMLTIVINTEGYIPEITLPYAMLDFMGYIDGLIDIDHMQ